MKRLLNILMLMLICAAGHATHNRAGQLLYKHISGYTYEFTQTQFYNSLSIATQQRINEGLDITWGDNTTSKIYSINVEVLPDNYTKVVFQTKHTFPGAGTYIIIMSDPNRNAGVLNIPNSVNVVFSVKTIFRIDPNTGHNNTPELLTYPIDKAAIGRRFVHNPSAFDIDGDSLSYEKAICLRERGIEIETYSFPETSNELYVDEITGDYVWDAPVKAGLYNIAMRINEWRDGIKISSVLRDIQVEVVDSKNQPPKIKLPKDTCVIAGAEINIPVIVTDPDNDRIILTATGGPFQVPISPATLTIDDSGAGYTNATFTWKTDYSHVRKQPYTAVFKAEDQNPEVKLVSFANYNITVIAPPVENLTVEAQKKEIELIWDKSVCDHASGYEIYRRIGSNDKEPEPCDVGIPAGWGYERVTTVNGINNTMYSDNNNGHGLSPGIEFCYRVVAIFADGAKSKPSNETCASLLAGTPPLIKAHVEKVDAAGEIHVKWLEKPVKKVIEDYIAVYPDRSGPFVYRLFYTQNKDEDNWKPLVTKNLGDTTYIHEPIDTKNQYHHFYKVELWDTGVNPNTIVDEDYEIASTLYPILEPSDKSVIITFGRYAPWINTGYDIYRCTCTGTNTCIPDTITEYWIGHAKGETFTDNWLVNGQQYCYRIKSTGYRKIDGLEYHNTNCSHVACVTPYDNVPPCAPELEAKSFCDENHNQLDWSYFSSPDESSCWYDVEKYRIYYSLDPARYPVFTRIDSVMSRDIFTYKHRGVLKGCYYVTAVDSVGNQSKNSNIVCLDECGDYELPNVFTPNGDGINDIFKSYNPGGVTRVDMKIFNRAGKLVFKTQNPDINWDGRDIDSKRFVPTGVYFYTCEVYEDRLTGQRIVPLSGIVHLYYGKDAQPYTAPSN